MTSTPSSLPPSGPLAPLILASKSPARTKILTEAGIPHRILVSAVDEDAVVEQHPDAGPAETALLLARAKAEAVASLPEADGALVLGCDSVFEFGGEALGKPYTPEVAAERLRAMSGRAGILHTGHWLVDCRDGVLSSSGELASAGVEFTEMSDGEIAAYVATGEPLHCAGSFTIDGLGGAFLARVDGDPHTVVGLSVSTLRTLLTRTGVRFTDFWAAAVVR
ncbi:nucleoside triphosphate pyrophosphatase [Sinomonas sp. JGH33]|uniref:Nucleoside triphosphate pyrophosphatase n=1 Tax=Sinomonas terricola TaxID=3110330 RepID=A0ABU5TA99_9MICC|nr:nucleoside triphosphate pyrophosphatase [Sinomonas sp. JGH33]MEA5456631.1 nucleoside triphosphate pyrophosphatase [Sinomonas sp. JGH33]